MKRRSFIAAMLAGGAAPAIVKASSIMRIAPQRFVLPALPIGMVQGFMPAGFRSHTHAAIENRILTDAGWMPCDGRVLSRSLYPELFKVLAPAGWTQGGDLLLPDLIVHRSVSFA